MIPAEVTKMPKYTIAIASGKGGTGKTTFAVNLAYVTNSAVTLMDCDVEAPNAHLFLMKINVMAVKSVKIIAVSMLLQC